ncbi:MAG: C2H2-type zinc finger protein [Candidatus Lokiarchaeota archaeon]|nr:C2H2-type zinc finger protein [Candidatus Lokiarchaeota archaeon]
MLINRSNTKSSAESIETSIGTFKISITSNQVPAEIITEDYRRLAFLGLQELHSHPPSSPEVTAHLEREYSSDNLSPPKGSFTCTKIDRDFLIEGHENSAKSTRDRVAKNETAIQKSKSGGFNCQVCGKVFSNRGSLTTHLKKNHVDAYLDQIEKNTREDIKHESKYFMNRWIAEQQLIFLQEGHDVDLGRKESIVRAFVYNQWLTEVEMMVKMKDDEYKEHFLLTSLKSLNDAKERIKTRAKASEEDPVFERFFEESIGHVRKALEESLAGKKGCSPKFFESHLPSFIP